MSIDAESSTCSKCGRLGCWTVADVCDETDGQAPVWFHEYTCRCGHVVSEEFTEPDTTQPGFVGGMGAP